MNENTAPNPMEVSLVSIDLLRLDERNARRGNVEAIVASLREFGQHRAVVVRRDTNVVVAGNHLVRAAKVLGWTHINAYFVDDGDEEAARRSIADNAVGDMGRWNDVQLASILNELGDFKVPGIDDKLVKRITKLIETPADYHLEPFQVQKPPKKVWVVLVVPTDAYHEISELVQKASSMEGVVTSVVGSDVE